MGMIQTLFCVTTGGDENGLAAVDVPRNGSIIGIDWSGYADLDADGEFIRVQLSFGSVGTFNVNDTRQTISQVQSQISLTTSGIANTSLQKYVGPIEIPVAAGERLYLHSSSGSGVVGSISCSIHYSFDLDRPLSRRG